MSHILDEQTTWFDRSDRLRLEISGPDRAKFLHNLTTNDVKRLAVGAGQESFITSPQGKTLAYITLLATDRAIVLRTDPGTADSFEPHLAKYGVFDDVEISDLAPRTFEYHLVGPGAGAIVGGLGVDPVTITKPLQHQQIDFAGFPLWLIRESPLGEPGWTVIGPREGSAVFLEHLAAEDVECGDSATFEARRIEAGTPVSGRDVQPNNLPQEVGRDSVAINFVKGCYLGQETVARLDALGHVNRILRGGRVDGSTEVPPVGTALVGDDGKTVGSITSAAYSSRRGAPVFLAYIRVAQAIDGIRLTIPSLIGADGKPLVAVVADLPAQV